ncbi:hypothetical protein GLOIN_2v1473966 [Rhizophagus clarus]|uniref:Uncharacterized protein n=1 Tax=Rhizophagus clarus TaxID=94130 RepID=A0A8H3KXX5_9GLOM|nr:hypothetical protein GLOIN_2v1473966 [Rhizophagus clarus]
MNKSEISSPPPSLFFSDNEISFNEFEQEKVSLENYNEIFNDDNNDINLKDFVENEEEQDKIIDYVDDVENIEFTPCVVIDFVKGKIQQCGEMTKLRQLRNLFGTWQVDREAIREVDGVLSRLGVYDSHFQFDNKYLHKSQNKQVKDFNQGIIQWRRCISCNKYITYFSQGVGCTIHSWKLNKQNIQVPCIGQYSCEALRVCPLICKRAFDDIKQQQCICCLCYEKLGGHIHHRPGKGKKATTCITEELHANDITKGLEYLGNWLINIAQTTDNETKKRILTNTFETLFTFCEIPFGHNITSASTTDNEERISLNEPPSLLMIKILFKEISKKKDKENINDYEQLGREFGKRL